MTTVAAPDQTKITNAIQKVTQIATLPEITSKIMTLVEDPSSTARDLQNVIKHDVALSAKILKVVNSAFYGLPRQVGSVDRAIVLLGMSTVKNIAVATSMAKLFGGQDISGKHTARDLWRHCLACGVFCKMLTKLRRGVENDEIFVAGLMHDIGILVEKQAYPKELAEAIELAESKEIDLWKAELEVLGADHQAFGTALANKWKFPPVFQIATGYHHQPEKLSAQHREVAATVYVADILATCKEVGFAVDNSDPNLDTLDMLGITEGQIDGLLEAFDEKFDAAEMVIS